MAKVIAWPWSEHSASPEINKFKPGWVWYMGGKVAFLWDSVHTNSVINTIGSEFRKEFLIQCQIPCFSSVKVLRKIKKRQQTWRQTASKNIVKLNIN